MVKVTIVPADEEVVCEGQDPGRTDSVIRSDVGHDGDL